MSSGSRLLFVGLRGSGKTSYLAALWHLIEAGELPTALLAASLQPDRQYLNRIRDSWLKFQEVGRTSLRNQETLSLLLRDGSTGSAIDITVPDLSGELFRLQWATRKANRSFAEFTANSSGILLLIHPATIKKSVRIAPSDTVNSKLIEHVGTDDAGQRAASKEANEPCEWAFDSSPTQVQLVELLQFVDFLRTSPKPNRIAVVISAWDTVSDPILPISWLEAQLPLLFQFLVTNADKAPFRTYGISALGGDLQKDLQKLQEEPVPSHRIKVVENKLEPHSDLTAPIRFVLGLAEDHSK